VILELARLTDEPITGIRCRY